MAECMHVPAVTSRYDDNVNILLTPIGSYGDVHPYIGIGMALQQHGHEVTLITNGQFESLAREVGLKFIASGPATKYLEAAQDRDLWHPRKVFAAAMTLVLSHIEELYRIIQSHNVPGQTVVVGHTMAFAARVAQEKLGIPLLGVHLSPAVFRSVHQPPVMKTGVDISWMPAWLQRLWWRGVDRRMIDPVVCPALNHWRWELGLEPVRRPLNAWIHSPGGILGLWPSWFAPVQRDWPKRVELTGFSMFDESGLQAMPAELRGFLAQGDPPIVFTPGSAMMHGHRFFEAAMKACERMGKRGVFLTRYAEQIPKKLPAEICYAPYVPLSQILPRAAAFVHHGGIGSCAQGLAAGIPQLVMPLSHDQPDNAARLCRLGVGRQLMPAKFTAVNIQHQLKGLIDVPQIWSTCKAFAMKCEKQNGRQLACDAIESFAKRQNIGQSTRHRLR